MFAEDWALELEDGRRVSVRLPARFDEDLQDRAQIYRLTSQVAIPEAWRGEMLSLSIPHFTGVANLEVGGEPAPLVAGEPRSVRAPGTQIWAIPPASTQSSVLQLTLLVEHAWTQSAWMDTVPRLALGPIGDARSRAQHAFQTWSCGAALGTLFTIGFTSLVLFLLHPAKSRGFGWLALQSFTASYYIFFILGTTQVFGVAEQPVLAFIASLSILAGVGTAHGHYGSSPPRAIWWTLMVVAIACVVYPGPFEATPVLGKLTIVVITVALLYQLVLHARMFRREPPALNSLTNFVGMAVFGVSMIPTIPLWMEWGDPFGGIRTTPVGLIVFSLAHFVALGRSHLETRRVAESRMQEIEVLNQELQRQVMERSKQLSDALSKLAANLGSTVELEPGATVDDRFEVRALLGRGAMGSVYRVERMADRRPFALKVLSRTSDSGRLARFAREALVASQLDHPNLVRLHDVGFASTGFMYLVMDLVEGRTLDEVEVPAEPEWVLEVLIGVTRGLVAIHDAGIVHRDLKPANIIVPDPVHNGRAVKIVDFGISGILSEQNSDGSRSVARPVLAVGSSLREVSLDESSTHLLRTSRSTASEDSRGGDRLTRADELVGTPAFMAPELALVDAPANPAADVFALGVIAYRCLWGTMPFPEAPVLAVLRGRQPPHPKRSFTACGDVPRPVAEVLDRCLEIEPTSRPTPTELLDTLESAARRVSRDAHRSGRIAQ